MDRKYYTSALTTKGNSSYSFVSQEEADLNAMELDACGFEDCINCKYLGPIFGCPVKLLQHGE